MSYHDRVRFCLACGSPVEFREVFGASRPVCLNCGRVHFFDPKVAAAVFVVRNERVLLVRRVNEPELGKWSLPAGFVDGDEDPRLAAQRECLEETGLQVEADRLLDVIHQPVRAEGASIVLVYHGRLEGGKLTARDDIDASGFFSRDELPSLAFESTRTLIERWEKAESGVL
jgi:ADP-ribose pyrophosphatase YjhB (NUDIX family)